MTFLFNSVGVCLDNNMDHLLPYIIPIILPSEKPIWEIICLILSAAGTLSAVFFSLFTFKKEKKYQKLQHILDQNRHLLDLAIEFPYLENDAYCANWTRENSDDKDIRYNSYCCEVFNMLEELYRYCNKNISKMEDIIYFKEYIHTHKNWWEKEISHSGGYGSDFINFINNIIHGR